MFNIIVAIDKNGGIGKNNTLPWKLSKDLRYFSKLTKGHGNNANAIIMGRKTFESIGTPLSDRINIVITKFPKYTKNIKYFNSINDAINFCKNSDIDNVWIIGGSSIYTQFFERKIINNVYITHIDASYNCDTFINWSKYSHDFKLIDEFVTYENDVKLIFRHHSMDYQKYSSHNK